MAYNPYGGHPYGQPPQNYNPYPGANQGPGMGYPPPGMSPVAAAPPGMAPPPGVHHQPPSAPQANRPPSGPHGYGGPGVGGGGGGRVGYGHPGGQPGYGAPPSFQPPANLPGNINFNAPVIRLGGASGPPTGPGASLPARPNIPTGPSGYNNGIPTGPGGGRRGGGDPDTPLSAHSGNGTPIRPDFRQDRFGGGDRFDRFDHRGERGDRFDRFGGDRNDRNDRNDRGDRGDRGDRDRDNRGDRDRGDRDRNGGVEQARAAIRDTMHSQAPPTNDEKLRTIFVHKVPAAGVGGEAGLQQLVSLVGRLRRFDAGTSHLADHKDSLFAFAQYEDANALASALALLKDVYVPVEKQASKDDKEEVEKERADQDKKDNKDEEMKDGDDEKKEDEDEKGEGDDNNDKDDPFKGIKKVQLQVSVDLVSLQYIKAFQEKQGDAAKAEAEAKQEALRPAFQKAIHDLFFPPKRDPAAAAAAAASGNAHGDVMMTDINGIPLLTGSGLDGLEALNIPLAAAAAAANQEDELADVPAEMREMVASEIASFRDRSTQRDLERLKREQEMEELERRRNGQDTAAPSRLGRLESPGPVGQSGTNSVPLGPRYGGAVHSSRVAFVSGGRENGDNHRDRDSRDDRRNRRDRDRDRDSDPDTDASDDELYRREQRKIQADDERLYMEAERKWSTRERQRAAALERERDRERVEVESDARHRAEALERDAAWDDEREASRKSALYYRDHAAWLRKRAHDRADEEARDAADRRAEQDETRKQAAAMESVRGQADSFLDGMGVGGEKAEEKADKNAAAAAAKEEEKAAQKVTISFGAAAQRNQAQRGAATRRTVAEVEGLLDDGEHEGATKRQLVPIKFEPIAASARMSDEEINEAVRALVQEIPTTQEGLWAWPVQWKFMDDTVVRDKLRPFVEKKVVEYLGVQEQFLVEVVEAHLRKHGTPQALVEELQEALDEAAEDLVKKLWRMVIFFTESEKRGLPA